MGQYRELTGTPGNNPVDLASAKAWLRVDDDITKDDTLIQDLLDEALDFGETYTGKSFRERKFDLLIDSLSPCGTRLMASVVNAVDQVQYVDADGNVQVLPTTDYALRKSSQYWSILPATAQGFPQTQQFNPQPWTISVTTDAKDAQFTRQMKQAMLFHVAYMYENRGDVQSVGGLDAPQEAIDIYRRYRVVNV